jgi:diguanylate cyclase (GGDEF)-like protein
MKLQTQINIAIVTAIVVGVLFFTSNHLNRRLLQTQGETLDRISGLQQLDQAMGARVLEATTRVTSNYDGIQSLSNDLKEALSRLLAEEGTARREQQTSRQLAEAFAGLLEQRGDLIQKFITLNSLLKNASTQIPTLNTHYLQQFGSQDTHYLAELSRLTVATFQAIHSLDPASTEQIAGSVTKLQAFHFSVEDPRATFTETLLAHAQVILRYLPQYRPLLRQIDEVPTQARLQELKQQFIRDAQAEQDRLSLLTLVLALCFILTIGLVIYVLEVLKGKHEKLTRLHAELGLAARQDGLTGLPNRFAFTLDLQEMTGPGLIIVNLDSFKQLNDFYGTDAGDHIIAQVGRELTLLVAAAQQVKVYRLGGDEFGLLQGNATTGSLGTLATDCIERIAAMAFRYGDYDMTVSARAGCSLNRPLLEKADMALKQAKLGRNRVSLYDDSLSLHTEVESNLYRIRLIKDAIKRDAVVPFFQPILNLHSKQINRYECLMRILDVDGTPIPPIAFLQVAKESHLYDDLTRIIIDKSIRRFRDEESEFSINLSVLDILDEGVTQYLFQKLEENPGVANRMILEILESEGVENYDAVKAFVCKAQEWGCKVAIDDFGSGYSSLQHVLELNADLLKIDGSLIRELHKNSTVQLLVSAIMEFVRGVGIHSVTAEFVHSQEVLEIVEAKGIDYAQGFHIGKPEPDLIRVEDQITWV